jgi:dipeptidyl-peptidase 4
VTSFPRQHARTRRFTLGVPRDVTTGVGPDGPVVLFLRSASGSDPVTHLWRHDPRTGRTERLVDATALGDDAALPPEERARRERAREQAAGIVAYAVDDAFTVAAVTVGGRLWSVDLGSGRVAEQPTAGPAFDPRPSPDGARIAYHAGHGLHVVDLEHGPALAGRSRTLVDDPEHDDVAWGRAEFIAAEEMGRRRGYWWSGDGTRLAVARVDERAVPVWTIADPAQPWVPPTPHRFPAAGTVNAEVSLWIVDAVTGERHPVTPPGAPDEYLASVTWGDGPLTLLVQPRDQRAARVLVADPSTGETRTVRTWTDDAWVEPVPGTPDWLGPALVTVEDRADLGAGGSRAVCLDGHPITPPGLQVREVLAIEPDADASRHDAARPPTTPAPAGGSTCSPARRTTRPGSTSTRSRSGRARRRPSRRPRHRPRPGSDAPCSAVTRPAVGPRGWTWRRRSRRRPRP